MKICDAISEVDNLKPNMFTVKDKIKWLSRLDMRIWKEIVLTHVWNKEELGENGEEPTFSGYTAEDNEKELLAPEPYDEMYVHWLEAQIDYNNMELEGFNASNSVFESVFSAFRNAYNASHLPKGVRKNYF